MGTPDLPPSDPPAIAENAAREPRAPWSRDLLLLGGFCLIAFFVLLGHRDLAPPDEGRYAEIPREMAARGDWVLPHLNGVVYFEKPPLVYWMVAASRFVFGGGEWSLRLTPAVFASLGVLLTYATGRRLFGRREGLCAALLLASSLFYFAMGRMLLLDMAVSALMTAALCCFILGVQERAGRRRRWLFYGLYASAALATLTKGLIGFLVPGAVMFLWLLLGNRWRRLRPFHLPSGTALFLAIAAPWHVLAALRNADWARFYFIHEHWLRYTTSIHDRVEPWWYFLPVLVLGLFPWLGFLLPAARSAWRARNDRTGERDTVSFLATWAVFILVFFSLSDSKLAPYVLPMFPPLALLAGRCLGRAMAEERRSVGLIIYTIFGAILAGGMIAVVVLPHGPVAPDQRAGAAPFLLIFAGATGAGVIGVCLKGWRVQPLTIGLMVGTAVAANLALELAAPPLVKPTSKPLAYYVRDHIAPGDRIFHYRNFFHEFDYYAETTVGTVDYQGELELQIDPAARASGRFIDDAELRRLWSDAKRIWLVVRDDDSRDLLADPAFASNIVAQSRGFFLLCNQPVSSASATLP